MTGMSFVDPGLPRGTFGMPSSAAASTCLFDFFFQFFVRGKDRTEIIMQLTQVLVKEGSGSDDDPLAASSGRTRSAHMRLRRDGHMHPVSLTPQLLTFPRARKGVVDFALRSIDVLDRRRGAERGL